MIKTRPSLHKLISIAIGTIAIVFTLGYLLTGSFFFKTPSASAKGKLLTKDTKWVYFYLDFDTTSNINFQVAGAGRHHPVYYYDPSIANKELPRIITLVSTSSDGNYSITLDVCAPTRVADKNDDDIAVDDTNKLDSMPVSNIDAHGSTSWDNWAALLKKVKKVNPIHQAFFNNLESSCKKTANDFKRRDITPLPNRVFNPTIQSNDSWDGEWTRMKARDLTMTNLAKKNTFLILYRGDKPLKRWDLGDKIKKDGSVDFDIKWEDPGFIKGKYFLKVYGTDSGWSINKDYRYYDKDNEGVFKLDDSVLSSLEKFYTKLQKDKTTAEDLINKEKIESVVGDRITALNNLFFDSSGNLKNQALVKVCYADALQKIAGKLPDTPISDGTLIGSLRIITASVGSGNMAAVNGSPILKGMYSCIQSNDEYKLKIAEIINGSNDGATIPDTSQDGTTSNQKSGDACGTGSGGGALRWILCPIVSAINDGIKWVTDNILTDALKSEPLDTSGTLYNAWNAVRNMANALLVVVFLVMIFLNFFSDGSNAYTIKKTLPRAVAAAILIQFTYFFCTILIDVGNVLGSGVGNLIMSAVGGAGGSGASTGAAIASTLLLGVVGIAGGVIATILGAWMLLLPLAIGLIISIITLLISLGVRIIAINLLIILAPIALLAWTLPNTEKYAKMWMQNMLKLIMMYPLIILLLSAAQVVVLIGAGNDGNTWAGVLTLFAPMIAFFMIPATFKMSGTMISGINNAIASKGKSLSSATAGALGKNIRDTIGKNAALTFGDPNSGPVRRTAARFGMGLGTGFGAGSQSRMKRASATAAAFKEKKDLLHHDFEEHGISGDNAAMMSKIFDKDWEDENGNKVGRFKPDVDNATRAAVMQMISENGGVEEMSAMYESMRARNKGETHSTKWNKEDRELWTRGTATTRDRLAKALPYAVRPDADRALGKMDAEGITSLKSSAGKATRDTKTGTVITQEGLNGTQIGDSHIEKGLDEIAARASMNEGELDPLGSGKQLTQTDINDAKMQQQKVFASMVSIGQSTDRRGRIDGENVKAFYRAAQAGLLGDSVVQVPGEGPMKAIDFAKKYIDPNTGQLKAVREH